MDGSIEELVVRAQSRDAAAFAELVRRLERTALSLALAGTSNAHSAADVTQEAFVRAWQRLDSLREPQRFASWLAGIVRNMAADHRRSRRRREASDIDLCDPAASEGEPHERLMKDEMRRGVAEAIEELDELSRSAVMLRYYENLSSKEIAEILELTPAAVDMRLMRARDALRKKLSENETPRTERRLASNGCL